MLDVQNNNRDVLLDDCWTDCQQAPTVMLPIKRLSLHYITRTKHRAQIWQQLEHELPVRGLYWEEWTLVSNNSCHFFCSLCGTEEKMIVKLRDIY